jgi:type IV secretory pathway VirD2 relaxase
MSNNDEKEFRLRPRKPPAPRRQNEALVWALAFKRVMHYARMNRRTSGPKSRRATRVVASSRNQRCAVRVTYSRNAARGQWRAHGRYVARESATFENDSSGAGFDKSDHGIDIAVRLEEWQSARDQRLWKLIVSPEFGERADLERLARDMMARMERDLGSALQWVAVAHHNTEHPHVHIALRGICEDGRALRLNRDYIKHGIRNVAEDFCTRQLGHRTTLDAAEAERREIAEKRFTSLDRAILREAGVADDGNSIWMKTGNTASRERMGDLARLRQQHIAARLPVLKTMGLAQEIAIGQWAVRRDCESVLRAMQRAGDRQKMLARNGVMMSDERLSIELLDLNQLDSVEGRVLVHGEDEATGRNYLMLEGTDARVHFVYYTSALEDIRNRGGLRTNSFIRLRRISAAGRPVLEVDDLGNSEAVLKNRQHLEETARGMIRRGMVPTEDGWGGWLGRYQTAVRETAERAETEPQAEPPSWRKRDRDRSRGR